jgi:Fe2+ or Zn2+ uptake regulation protein
MTINKLRMTPQTQAVLNAVKYFGHCSNAQILKSVKQQMPFLSATTVHRITARLIKNGILSDGPKINGVILIDSNTVPHDHFVCSACKGVKDIWIDDNLRKKLQDQTNATIRPYSLVVIGDCVNCNNIA